MAEETKDGADTDSGELRSTTRPRTGVIAGRTFMLKRVQFSDIDGDAIFEGDILLGKTRELEQAYERLKEADDIDSLKGIFRSGEQFRWPGGIIPFRIDPALPNPQRVLDAIKHWHEKTPIKLVGRTAEPDFVTFRPVPSGCSSAVGRAASSSSTSRRRA